MNKPNPEDIKASFEEKGFVVIDSGIEDTILDSALEDMQEYFRGKPWKDEVPYVDQGRVQDGWYTSESVLGIAQAPKVLKALESLYGKKARPFQTLNFPVGTQQAPHSDSIHFNSEPFGMMCGVWVALEDVGMDQGPLIYYPGSQKLPEMNYEDFDLPPSYDHYGEYIAALQDLVEEHNFQPEYGVLKKGDALIWSANIIHGGSPQTNPELTRHSQVTHYFIGQPKCWRPSESANGRAYFTPPELAAGMNFREHHKKSAATIDVGDTSSSAGPLGFFKRAERSIKFRIKHYILKK